MSCRFHSNALAPRTLLGAAAIALAAFTPTQPQDYDADGYPVWTAEQMQIPALPSAPDDAVRITANLDGKVFGIKMIEADYDGWLGSGDYALRSDLSTSGLGALLKKLRIWSVTQGRWDGTGLHPASHVQQNRDKKRRRVEMDYGEDGVEVSVIPPNGSQGIPPASPEERFASDDALSALFLIMVRRQIMGEATCEGVVPVFDSKQHYNLRLADRGIVDDEMWDYEGPVRRCDIYYEPVSGFDPEDLPDADEQAQPIKVWFGDIGGWDIPLKFSYKISGFRATIRMDKLTMEWPDGRAIELT